ncbi:abortive infection system antitoxin AbiGi family protein [Plesiomonas sp. PI-19]|uniref:abortive infection system antitoxin AbiGi family protein n=1 Tax=Plesiomonas sp. PI-19 TaxID=2898798 RepID=UPI001F218C65|nr:abortive infection system antitoxin AbiGi family protein [Plesiomonas sp. PI-19]MCE5163772.1 abortive infection system antitoxin AbiGi family protein [Plesiomonas sp. PI-19]
MPELQNSSLYPDILFHFTDKNGLFRLLESTFKVSYARERIEGKQTVKSFGIPMISFCDLKLSELKVHMGKYGSYGIGMTKEWANRKGLNPVWYVNKYCNFADEFSLALDGIFTAWDVEENAERVARLSDDYMRIVNTYRYIKNYEGTLIRQGEQTPNFRFADEREWRFVPPIGTKGVLPFVPVEKIATQEQKAAYNDKIDVSLHFTPDDIKYLIVNDDNEITELINHLRVHKDRFEPSVIDRLASRILTAKQINNDM